MSNGLVSQYIHCIHCNGIITTSDILQGQDQYSSHCQDCLSLEKQVFTFNTIYLLVIPICLVLLLEIWKSLDILLNPMVKSWSESSNPGLNADSLLS